jgi:heptosyltransferase-2
MVLRQTRFLLLRGGAIGDFILTLPALRLLREHWPDAHIELIGYPHVANLARAGGLVDDVLSLDSAHIARLFSLRPELPDDQVKYIRSFDVIVSWLHDPDGVVKDNLLNAGARQVIYGSPLVDSGHAVDQLVKPLETLALYGAGSAPVLEATPTQKALGRGFLDALGFGNEIVAIHPGSGSAKKNWPVACFMELAERLGAAGAASPLFILGEADDAVAQVISSRAGSVPQVRNLPLEQLAGILACCGRYVGNDSGITHLAAALGLRVVALFGPTDPERWGPRGERVRVLHGDLGAIAVDRVVAALELA